MLLCLALLLVSSSGAVWCRGEDGHLRLERGGDSCCEHAVGRVAAGAAPCEGQGLCTDVAHLEGCGNCVDVPLTLGADKARTAAAAVALAVLPTSTPAGKRRRWSWLPGFLSRRLSAVQWPSSPCCGSDPLPRLPHAASLFLITTDGRDSHVQTDDSGCHGVARRAGSPRGRWLAEWRKAPELTLAEARARALASSPALAAAGAGVSAAEGELRQAGAWPNPELEAEAEELDGFLSRSAESETTLALRQPLPLLSRRPRLDVARWSSEGARAGLDVTRLDLVAEVERRFATALAAQERLALAEGSLATAREVAATVRALVEAGEVSPIELSRAEAEAVVVATELSSCRLGLDTARLALAETLGEGAPSFGVLTGTLAGEVPIPALDALQDRLTAMPEQRRLESEDRRLSAELALALRERWPEPAVRVGTFFRGIDPEPAYVAGVSFQLPLWDRKQGAIAAARARQEIGRQHRRAEDLRRGAALASAHATLVQAQDETTPGRPRAAAPGRGGLCGDLRGVSPRQARPAGGPGVAAEPRVGAAAGAGRAPAPGPGAGRGRAAEWRSPGRPAGRCVMRGSDSVWSGLAVLAGVDGLW